MAGIGGVTCTFVSGMTPDLAERVVTFQIPGMDGYGAQTMGLGDSECMIVGRNLASNADMRTWFNALRALQGQLITVVDDWGNTIPDGTNAGAILVERVRIVSQEYDSTSGALGIVRLFGKCVAAVP